MAHGNKDYFTSIPLNTLYGMVDLAEAVVRLGSIVAFDRRGTVVWLDGFEEGVAQWTKNGDGAGWVVTLSNERAISGGYSCKLRPGSDGLRSASIIRGHRQLVGSLIGFEYSLYPSDDMEYITSSVIIFSGDTAYDFTVRYHHVNKVLQYKTSMGLYTTFASNINLYGSYSFWSTFKFVIDPTNLKYVYARVNENDYNIAGADPYVTLIENPSSICVSMLAKNKSGKTGSHYLDNIILTTNE